MKPYETPEILIQPIAVADVLTNSPGDYFVEGSGSDDENVMNWWG